MRTFTTPKGTQLPVMDLKGKDYLQVAYRILWFREDHPLGLIESKCVESTEKYVVYTASISIRNENGLLKVSDGVKREDYAHFSDAHEKAQTGAIGRALALCGFGTQFTDDMDEGDRLADAPVVAARKDPTTPTPKVGNVTRVGSTFGGNGSAF